MVPRSRGCIVSSVGTIRVPASIRARSFTTCSTMGPTRFQARVTSPMMTIRGRESIDEHGKAQAEIVRHHVQSLLRFEIATVGQRQDIGKGRYRIAATGWRLSAAVFCDAAGIVADSRGIRSQHFPATPAATFAGRALLIEADVAKFSGGTIRSSDQLSVGDDAGSNAF